MRKAKNIYQTFKTLFLVFAVCFLAATQSIAQSNSEQFSPQSVEMQKQNTFERFTIWNFFEWFKAIVTTDMSVFTPIKHKAVPTPPIQKSINKGTRRIVTTDMSVREGNKED